MMSLDFTKEYFEHALEKEFIYRGFDKIQSKFEEDTSLEGNADFEFFIKNIHIGNLNINYDQNLRRINLNSIRIFDEHKRKGFGRKIVTGLEEVSQTFYFKEIILYPTKPEAEKFWKAMEYFYDGSRMKKELN